MLFRVPTLNRIKLRHFRTLIAVAESGSLVRAAETLSLTQPAVSKTLAELEQIVGALLCERTPKGVELTGKGRELVRYATSGLRTIEEGIDRISGVHASYEPPLVIGALPAVAATILPPALLRYTRDMANATVTVRTGSNSPLIADLAKGSVDAVIGRMGPPSAMQGLSFEHLYTEGLVFVVRPGHPLSKRGRLRAIALRDFLLVLPEPGTLIREAADRYLIASAAGMLRSPIQTADASLGHSFVHEVDAVWCVSLGVAERDVKEGRLEVLHLGTQLTAAPIGLTLRSDKQPSERLRHLLDEIRTSAAMRVAAVAENE